MIQIGESSYYFDPSSREVYRKVKMTKQGYHIKDKHGKLKWITLATIEKCLVKMTNPSSSSSQNDYSQNDYPTATGVLSNSQNDYDPLETNSQNDYNNSTPNCTESTECTECDNITEEYPDNDESYGTFGEIERRGPRTPIRNIYEEEDDKIYEPDENGFIW